MDAAFLRRVAVFVVVFGGGVGFVAATSGGFSLPPDPRGATAASARLPDAPGGVVPVAQGASLGPGRRGRLERDDIEIVGGRPVTYRELTAEWASSAPAPSHDPETAVQELEDARLVFHPRPTADEPAPPATETAPGVTILSGRHATLRRKGEGPVSAHLEGDCAGSHLLDDGETLVLRSPSLDFHRDERGAARTAVHVLSTEQPVRMDGGGAEVAGTGLVAELEPGRADGRGRKRRVFVRVLRDVDSVFRGEPRKDGSPGPEIRVRCAGAAEIETLDAVSTDGRQPWRATFQDDVRVDETLSRLRADHAVVEFVRTGAADRAAGAPSTEVRTFTATGNVVVDGGEEGSRYHLECQKLRRFAEDAVTDVTVVEGSPVLRFVGRAQSAGQGVIGGGNGEAAAAALSVYEVRCTGPVTVRERRSAAPQRSAAQITFVAEGDVVATERRLDGDRLRSEVRAPRVTIEALRDAAGRMDPRVIRGEQGATARWEDFAAEAQTISATATPAEGAGALRRIALVGRPVLSWRLAEGSNPLGGAEPAGLLVVTSDSRIDAEIAPDPPAGTTPSGTRTTVRTADHFVARKTLGATEAWSWRLEARRGEAKIGWDGMLDEMRAVGAARLDGRRADDERRTGDLTGETITVVRAPRPAAPEGSSRDAWRRLDVTVDGTESSPARASLVDALDEDRTHVVSGRRLFQSEDGTVLTASGSALAELHRGAKGSPVTLRADTIRVDVDPAAEDGRNAKLLTATGTVRLEDAVHRIRGDRVVYSPLTGEAETTAAGGAVLVRNDDPAFPSYVRGPTLRAWFDPEGTGGDAFLRALLPEGGEVVGYRAQPTHRRVTATSRGAMELTRTSATGSDQVVCVSESRPEPGAPWHSDSRIDCSRVEIEFEPDAEERKPSERIRSLVALGTPSLPARIRTRNPAGDREAYAEAERIEAVPGRAALSLTCPSQRTSVLVQDVTGGRRLRCDSAKFDYETHEWSELVRARSVD